MALRKIARMGEPLLRRVADTVPRSLIGSPRLEQLIEDMVATMRDADGAGLAAPQVFESLQLCVIELLHNPRYPGHQPIELTVLINPVIEPLVANPEHPADEDSVVVYEGCLSVPGVRGRVRRPRKVKVSALNRVGQPIEEIWSGMRAAVVQHETDHLFGKLFIDRAEPSSLCFLQEYERHVPPEQRFFDGGRD